MTVKQVRWAASVYGRILRETAEWILKKYTTGHLRWMRVENPRVKNVKVVDDTEGAIYTDGSRRGGHMAAATTRDSWYLGETATVMDARDRDGVVKRKHRTAKEQ